MKSLAEALWYALVKTSTDDTVSARQRDAQTIEVLGPKVIYYKQHSLEQRSLRAWVVLFLENMLPLQW